ncbi:MAG TPA: YifB family Mg chelatase-like AAA ATPase [Micromonosporaceae bacterium]|nr:YifB family Mg chelatase-like AAA ATPase [Micromonosporaceae bacterium]
MSYAKTLSIGLVGLTGHLVEVEADLANGLPALTLAGLPDTALHEARDRVRAAVVNSGQSWPNRRITINLLPATLPKHGSSFDVAIALALLASAGELPPASLAGVALLGELGLDGSVRPVRGALPMVHAAAKAGLRRVVVPLGNAHEAGLVPGIAVRAADTLRRLVDFVRGAAPLLAAPAPPGDGVPAGPDLADIVGQGLGRRSLEVAAAGAHHLALVGPPGAGKTMLAQRLPSVLPALTDDEALEVTAVHSVAGVLPAGAGLVRRPPYQAPHHTASMPALVGGGSGLARPGAVSLAHRGVLFLDEAPEFSARVLEALRQPLEDGYVCLARAGGMTHYPAQVQLVLAANPCPCAKPGGDHLCECSPLVRRRYLARLSGPLLDRIDLRVRLRPVTAADLLHDRVTGEPSAAVAERVARARALAAARWSGQPWCTNAHASGGALRGAFRLPRAVTEPLRRPLEAGSLSARGYLRVLRLAWTVADLDGRDRPATEDVHEAYELRMGDAL